MVSCKAPEYGNYFFLGSIMSVQVATYFWDVSVTRNLHSYRKLNGTNSEEETSIRCNYSKAVRHAKVILLNFGQVPPCSTCGKKKHLKDVE